MSEEDCEFITNLWNQGVDKMNAINPERAQGRLEYVLKQHPDIDPERLQVATEIQDVLHSVGKEKYIVYFRAGAKDVIRGLVYEGMFYGGFQASLALDRMNVMPGDLLSNATFGLSMLTILPGLGNLVNGSLLIYKAVKEREEFYSQKWSRVLTDRERQLVNYVLMKD